MPAGLYVIGDPCYHVPDAEWDSVLDESGFFNGQCWASFRTFNGRTGTVVAFSTVYGDGVYQDAAGRRYPVDAGLIGLIPLEDVDPNALDLSCANVIEFKTSITCKEKEGVITFGFVEVDTDPPDGLDEELDAGDLGDPEVYL